MTTGITPTIPREIEDILVDVKYIARLPPSSKYDLEHRSYVDATNIFTRVHRTLFTDERRTSAFSFINQTITAAIETAQKHHAWGDVIVEQLTRMDDAIANLKHVYSRSPESIARLETIELRIDEHVLRRGLET